MNWRDVIEFRAPYQAAYFKGTDTRVLRVMLCLANGWTEAQVLMMHPEVTTAHIEACLSYGAECDSGRATTDTDPALDPELVEVVLRRRQAGTDLAANH